MDDLISESCSSSDVVALEYESTLSAGLEISQYYLSKCVRDSTKQQVLLCSIRHVTFVYNIPMFLLVQSCL
jgi:hypothetical protein